MVAVFAAYALVALAANWPNWPLDPTRTRVAANFGVIGSTDVDLGTWFLGWTAHAVVHGLNPFYTTALNYPFGINLVQNTASPLLGLLAAPFTILLNPIASMNLLLWLAFPVSAFSLYWVLRHFVKWDAAAIAGGALYGFSPWLVTQDQFHLNLCFVPLPPLIFFATYELLRAEQTRPVRAGIVLGLLVAAQFLISTEIAAMTVVMVLVGLVIVWFPRRVDVLATLRRSGNGVAAALLTGAILLAYPLYVMFRGPYRFVGSPNPGGEAADLLNPLLPTSLQRVSLGQLGAIGNHLVFGNTSENGGYLGLPLIALCLIVLIAYWRRPWVRFASLMALVSFVFSLGQHLDVNNVRTAFPLPYAVLQGRPFFSDILQVRFGLFVALFVAVVVVLGLDEWHQRHVRTNPGTSVRAAMVAMPTGQRRSLYLVLGLTIATLVPSFPLATASANVPSYFSSAAVNRVAPGSVVLISPYPSVFDPVGQVWQSVAHDRFSIIGGYGLFSWTGPAGSSPAPYPPIMKPEDVQMFLTGEADGTPFQSGPIPTLDHHLVCDFRTYLTNYGVAAVLDGPIPPSGTANPAAITSLFTMALGSPSQVSGAIAAWYDVPGLLRRTSAALGCEGT